MPRSIPGLGITQAMTSGNSKSSEFRSGVAIVIATYNEMETLPELVDRLWQVIPDARIIVVDDNSPDGTGQWAEALARDNSRLRTIHRERKQGLGVATLAGLRQAMHLDVQWIATLDADLSHDPGDLRRMLDMATRTDPPEWDVVIGSRYVAGGSIENWPWHRRWTSRLVNSFARRGLGLPTHDNSGALRLYRQQALNRLDLDQIHCRGHAYLEEILMRLAKSGARMTEVPITFRDRIAGKSTVNWRGWCSNAGELLGLVLRR